MAIISKTISVTSVARQSSDGQILGFALSRHRKFALMEGVKRTRLLIGRKTGSGMKIAYFIIIELSRKTSNKAQSYTFAHSPDERTFRAPSH